MKITRSRLFIYKINYCPNSVYLYNWNNSLNINQKKKFIFKLIFFFLNIFSYKYILYKKISHDILKNLEFYVLNTSIHAFNKFKCFYNHFTKY